MRRLIDFAALLLQLANAVPGGQRLMSVMKFLLPIVLAYAAFRGFIAGAE